MKSGRLERDTRRMSFSRAFVAGLIGASLAAPALAQEKPAGSDAGTIDKGTAEKVFKAPGYSPYAGRNYPTRVLWGDTHLHTAISLDAGAVGCTLSPEAAYRFARGQEVVTSTGQQAQLSRPLDFLVVSDHAEAFGSMVAIIKDDPRLLANLQIKRWNEMIKEGGDTAFKAAWELIAGLSDPSKMPAEFKDPEFVRTIWEPFIRTADEFNEPGRFTAFIGYEWSSQPGGDNLHRVVVFRDGADKAIHTLPFSNLDSENPEDLWKVLAAYEQRTGGRVLAIPHNGNISGGRMFALVDFMGNPLTRDYAEKRARWEPLLEATQQKGDSESHPVLSPTDEFAAYEDWDKMNLAGTKLHQDAWLKYEYAREALKNGLKLEQQLGANPFKFGMIGSTDSHVGISAVEEDNFFGKAPPYEPQPTRAEHSFSKSGDTQVTAWEMGASGYAGVWATENTRESLWDAMKRKEVYATTGSRLLVRFFGGWDFDAQDALTRNPAIPGYSKGVPMGGDLRLPEGAAGRSPTFLVAALTVDVANATWSNTIGDPELIAVWKDPAFDPKQRAFYYARVIEIPTPRWTAYDAERFGVTMPPEVPMTTQERAYTSPIWYTPGK